MCRRTKIDQTVAWLNETSSLRDTRMAREVELSSLDLRYEGLRLKAAALEERAIGSIAQRGIENR